MWVSWRVMLAGMVALVGGCGSESPSGGACVTNRDCADGQICLGRQCKAVERVGCQNDLACEAGQYCDLADRTCKDQQVTACTTDDACPPDQRCNTLTGVCILGRRACTSDAQCASISKYCDLSLQQCVDCAQSFHCTAPQMCLENRCVDPTQNTCQLDTECNPPNTVCESTQCVPGCNVPGSPVTCGLGTFCNTNTGRCEAGQVTCGNDTECSPPASICESGQCIPGCTQVGGLQCTGGYTCNSTTGRCEAPMGCTTDAQCGAPAQVCEASQCVPGCGRPGGIQCGAGTVCNNGTGRCDMIQGSCASDAQCGPPNSVCESGQCVPGCTQIGGVQCSGGTTCNSATGRCDPAQGGCTVDAQCGPPANICDQTLGQCVPGCGTAGCSAPLVCNTGNGRCENPQNPGGLPLNAVCNAHADCQSRSCFDFGSSIGNRCIQSCGGHADCPASFTCYDYSGGKMCISSQLFSGATFSGANGSVCANGGQCQSNFCSANQCVGQCSDNGDCGGTQCRWSEIATDLYATACLGPAGSGSNGAFCAADSDCRGGICYGAGTCGDPCGASADCPNGNVCAPVNYSLCLVDLFGLCLDWQISFVKACVQGTHGSAANGAQCTDPGGANCRGGFCWGPTNQCTGTCSRDSDCGAGLVCRVELYGDLDGEEVFINICAPQ